MALTETMPRTDRLSTPDEGSAVGQAPHKPTIARRNPTVLARLEGVTDREGLPTAAERLRDLQQLLAMDMVAFERELAAVEGGDARVQRGASHLVGQAGKRLRPICVMLASKLGGGLNESVLAIAVAAELVHNATLLHDDVVDLGDVRRGAPTTRAIYGNASSVFAGDWLLIQAQRRVRQADPGRTFGELLDTIEAMILAESIQLDYRGTLDMPLPTWLEVVEGKTAALFRWAMSAGGRAGGLDPRACERLEDYGLHLGVAFQAIDDLLDLSGDPEATGKELFADLREGKMTWPLIAGLERDPDLRATLERATAEGADLSLAEEILSRLDRVRALDDCRALAEQRARLAVEALETLPEGPARSALETAAKAAVERRR